MQDLTIYHTIPHVGPESFGVGPVALNLALEQGLLGKESWIWCLDSNENIRWASAATGISGTRFRQFANTGPRHLRLSFPMERAARDIASNPHAVLHEHGVFVGLSRVTRVIQRARGNPTIVAPHGSLESWAVKKSHWKKRIALELYERKKLREATCLHACSTQESAGIREYGLTNPIAVIPNGVASTWLKSDGDGDAFRKRFNLRPDARIALFLSRIAPVKGLPLLLEAISVIRSDFSDWLLVIAGSDESGHEADLRELIRKHRLQDSVVFTGLLLGQAKRDAFAAAELFVLPTKRENFGIVVAEALAAGVPVLTTKGAPWQDLTVTRSGWWVDASTDALAASLKEALRCSPAALRLMGERGKALVEERYSWHHSAQMTIRLYEWLLGRGEQPEFVLTS